jgi:transcriptional regulator with XRE-family HTH domain
LENTDKTLTINERFSLMRHRLKLTKNAVGEAAGISGTTIGNIETGTTKNPSSEILAGISKNLGVSLEWLIFGEGEMLKGQQSETTDLTSGAATVERATELASNGLLREIIDTQKETIADLRGTVEFLKSELGKFGGSLEAALQDLVPTRPRTGVLVPQ